MRQAWSALRSGQQPPLIAAAIERTLARLARAVRHRQPLRTLTAALDLHESGLDLELRHRPRIGIDRDRMELWCQRLRADARARNPAAVSGDAATLEWIRDRLADPLPPGLDGRLAQVRAAADAKRVQAAADHAARLIGILRAIPRI
jgi:hypothetical protein